MPSLAWSIPISEALLPCPSSPDLSPIEKCWSKLKAILRAKAARTRTYLDQAITEALDMMTGQDARGWFAHCGYV